MLLINIAPFPLCTRPGHAQIDVTFECALVKLLPGASVIDEMLPPLLPRDSEARVSSPAFSATTEFERWCSGFMCEFALAS